VLDLRDNPGGDNSFSDPMIAWFATRPFRFASDYRLKASVVARQALARIAAEYPGGISAQMLEAMRDRADGERFAFPIPDVQPREGTRYTGRVWALVNRHTNSNATAVAAIVQDYGFATVLGEETSDVPAGYGSIAQFTLPNTGIGVTYPKSHFVRPSGDTAARGVVPTYRIARPVVPAPEDAVLDTAIMYIRSRRR
jgi:C-terminal processing protease CtpA/Prc